LVTSALRVLLAGVFVPLLLAFAPSARALDADAVTKLASEDAAVKVQAIASLASAADPAALPVLEALRDGNLSVTPEGRVLIVDGGSAKDALTGEALATVPESAQSVGINNRVRGALDSALSAFALFSSDREIRLKAARGMESSTSESLLPMLSKALEKETDPKIRASLEQTRAGIAIKTSDPKLRLEAVKVLAQSNQQRTKTLLLPLLEQDSEGKFIEPDEQIRNEAELAIKMIDRRVIVTDYAGRVFTGISLGSILLLAALGFALRRRFA